MSNCSEDIVSNALQSLPLSTRPFMTVYTLDDKGFFASPLFTVLFGDLLW